MVRRQHLAVAPVILAADDGGIDVAAIEGGEEIAGIIEPDLDGERGIVCVEPRQQGWHLGASDMGGNAEREAAWPRGRQPRDGAIMCGEQVACGREEGGALCRQAHQARCALDQPVADLALEPLQLDADRTLRGAERFGRARKTPEVGDGHEGLHGIDVERGHVSHPELLSLKYLVIQFTNAQAVTSFLL
ncbi:hypothetical protein BraRD5C2_50610 [Bradyrhizobium sp. RD5-C2]|nr:hypothetical protein BraRD5C2_50610 [Bradyrhizobium sp. RD5-C2]